LVSSHQPSHKPESAQFRLQPTPSFRQWSTRLRQAVSPSRRRSECGRRSSSLSTAQRHEGAETAFWRVHRSQLQLVGPERKHTERMRSSWRCRYIDEVDFNGRSPIGWKRDRMRLKGFVRLCTTVKYRGPRRSISFRFRAVHLLLSLYLTIPSIA
jgi:hypothetical protein